MKLKADQSVLVLVDYQERLTPAIYKGEQVLAEALAMAKLAKLLKVPVIATEQNPAGLGPNPAALKALCDTTLPKMHFDACADGLLESIASTGKTQVVVAGCEAHVCLMQTVLGLHQARLEADGFELAVVASACSSRRESDRELGLARLKALGLAQYSFEMLAFEWLGTAQHATFKDALKIIKAQAL